MDSAVFLTKDERSYDSDSPFFITGFFFVLFFKADGALYSKPPNHTFSPDFKESPRRERSGWERGGG